MLQEAIANGNPSLVKLVMKYRNYQRNVQRIRGIPELLPKLKEVNDRIAVRIDLSLLLRFSRQVRLSSRRLAFPISASFRRFLRGDEMGIFELG